MINVATRGIIWNEWVTVKLWYNQLCVHWPEQLIIYYALIKHHHFSDLLKRAGFVLQRTKAWCWLFLTYLLVCFFLTFWYPPSSVLESECISPYTMWILKGNSMNKSMPFWIYTAASLWQKTGSNPKQFGHIILDSKFKYCMFRWNPDSDINFYYLFDQLLVGIQPLLLLF